MDKKTMHNSVESPQKILTLPTIRKIPIEWTERLKATDEFMQVCIMNLLFLFTSISISSNKV